MTPDIIIGAIAVAVSMLLGAVCKNLLDLRKQKGDYSLSANEQALSFYKNLIDTLQKQAQQLIADSNKLESEYVSTRESNAELKSELKFIREIKEAVEEKLKKCTCNIAKT